MAKEDAGRVKSGVKGLDRFLGGGFLPGQSVLVCGMPGTGKTILGLQYLYSGVKEFGENGIFVTVEDHPEKLRAYSRAFGWDLERFEKEKKIRLFKVPIDYMGYKIVDEIEKAAKKARAGRMVIDSLSALNMNSRMFDLPLKNQPDPTRTISRKKVLKTAGFTPFEDIQQFTYLFINRISEMKKTTLFLTDSVPGEGLLTKDGVSEFACDGVIDLQLHDTSRNVNRTIAVKKLRGSDITPGMNSLKFTKTGLEVGEFKAFY